jgi:hypothetical protein
VYKIAIQPQNALLTSGRYQSFSARWEELLRQAGHAPLLIDAAEPDFFERVRECDGYMWWYAHLPYPRNFARRLVSAIEHGMGIPVFPTWKTVWHFDDKVGQYYLLRAAEIPTAPTSVFWFRQEALEYCRTARYPLVIKLAGGITSENVRMLKDFREAEYWINRMFGGGTTSLAPPAAGLPGAARRGKDALRLLLKGAHPLDSLRSDVQRGYVLLQEFLPGNDYDTRVTVIGNRAFAFRRMNRPGDFRASGSGRIDFDPSKIDPAIVRLAFAAQRKLESQSLAIDGMYHEGRPVIVEISYYYEGWAVAECPGHWELHGRPEDGRLEWVPGTVRPEDAILEDFLALLNGRRATAAGDAVPLAAGGVG